MLTNNADQILAPLNPAQRQAVEAGEGPLLIIAGPGSGKTRVITHRVAYLVRVCGVSPYRILAVTFTNKAAREMKERLAVLLGDRLQQLTVGTFHAICARILRQEAAHAGLDPRFVIYDDDDQQGLIKRAFKDLGLDDKRVAPRAVLAAISAAKSKLLTPREYDSLVSFPSAATRTGYFEEVVARVYARYQLLLAESNALDFDDLLLRAVQLFQNSAEVCQRYQERYVYVLVDEFQDTNPVQYALIRLLARQHQNICVVGDPDQSIYAFRFADIRNILSFEMDFPGCQVIALEQNYRSTQTILEAADAVIMRNPGRKRHKLWTQNERGLPITVLEAYDEREEGQFIVREVERLTRSSDLRLRDCAIMYRTNAQSRAIEESFLRYGLPYRLVSGTRFYQRKEIKDAIAYLRLIHNPFDSVSLQRVINVPPRKIGEKSLDKLSRWANVRGVPLYATLQLLAAGEEDSPGHGSAPDFDAATRRRLTDFLRLLNDLIAQSDQLNVVALLDYVLERSGYRDMLQDGSPEGEERWSNLGELRTVANEFSDLAPRASLAAFLERVALVSEVDGYDEQVDAATLITLHTAKGLEFAVVFIAGLEEGTLPHARALEDEAQMEEERRLCYVGMTRAKERLYLCRATHRTLWGVNSPREPSRFLRDLPPQALPGWEAPAATRGTAREAPVAVPLRVPFKDGDRVRHSIFGEGVVVRCLEARGDWEVTVVFKGSAGLKKLLASYAKLQHV